MNTTATETAVPEEPAIHDRGRGPEIKGTRITVYSILDWMIEGWHCERIADFFHLHPQEVQAAMDYVREHTLEVLREYVKILERGERGNPPELQATVDARHEQYLEIVKKVTEAQTEGKTDSRSALEEFRASGRKELVNGRDHGRS